ncbi:hypothetical protein P43SY_007023 [Pythium insidiosum]|uniref:RXYLT1 C-terminal domain-containing protein n=1 Tax=Pythium insidiosum TaxID=114742 RepID=A0AAD5QDI1_PYTIN|nr:hypothetical protein P43SY_007023 [Pythium insidiosum]
MTRELRDSSVQLRLIGDLSATTSSSLVLLVVQGLSDVLHFLNTSEIASSNARVAFYALSREDCNNPDGPRLAEDARVAFGFVPYGDCGFVDGDRFSVIPLGPSYEHGFPLNAHKLPLPDVDSRPYLLNLMVSWTPEKPTRMQALMAAEHICGLDGSRCIIEHGSLMFKVLQLLDNAVGSSLRWRLSSAPQTYFDNLRQSVFTLCPMGKNPEQYRIWEALAAGSIPIIEDMPALEPGTFWHPAYPKTWRCVREDIHGFLKRMGAPVIFVSDWQRDLPRVLAHYTQDHPDELLRLQRRVRRWYRQQGEHLQAELLAKLVAHSRSDSLK